MRFDPDLPQTLRLEFAKTNTKISKQRHFTPHYQPFHGMPPPPPPHFMPHPPPPPPPAFHSPGSAGSAFGSLTGLNGAGVGLGLGGPMNYCPPPPPPPPPPANSFVPGGPPTACASSVAAALQQALNNAAAASYVGSFGPRTPIDSSLCFAYLRLCHVINRWTVLSTRPV